MTIFYKIVTQRLTLVVLICFLISVPCTANTGGVAALLPGPDEIGNLSPAGSPQTAEGDDLFLLINGGAEIYHEYGFKEAVIQGYSQPDKKNVNLEIYRMKSPEAAFGIFSFKTWGSGSSLAIGNGACLDQYYINFWKGEYLVTVIGFDDKRETLALITRVARAVAAKIKRPGVLPAHVKLLPVTKAYKPVPGGIKYLRGQLALYNHYPFDPENIFGLGEGVIGDYGRFQLYIFVYSTETESGKYFKQARVRLGSGNRFRQIASAGKSGSESGFLSIVDKKGKMFFFQKHRKYIQIVAAEDSTGISRGQELLKLFYSSR